MIAMQDAVGDRLTEEEAWLAALPPEAFRAILSSHRREGFDAGYRRAISDILAASVFLAEKSLRTAQRPTDARQVIYRFIQLLEQQVPGRASADEVSDGLGI